MFATLGVVAVAAAAPPPLSPLQCANVTLEIDYNYNGNDLPVCPHGWPAQTLADCCTMCSTTPNCSFFTYNAPSCHLKYANTGREHRPGVTSGSLAPTPPPYHGSKPNIVFLIVESTDGRTHHQTHPSAYMPNLRKLQKRGVYFHNFYSNSPVCAPSRSATYSGKHVHRIPHVHNGVPVNGAWNNAEGNSANFSLGWLDVLAGKTQPEGRVLHGTGEERYSSPGPTSPKAPSMPSKRALFAKRKPSLPNRYAPLLGDPQLYAEAPQRGKTDWTVGGHALWNWLQCWTMYVPFPFSESAPWSEQPDVGQCQTKGKIDTKKNRTHNEDWNGVRLNTEWITSGDAAATGKPWFVYQGMNIIHPPYATTKNWYDKINHSAVTVPKWLPLDEIHPCDLQASMLKGCVPPKGTQQAAEFYDEERRRTVRHIYLAMIAEFDAMVGAYVDAVDSVPGLREKTIFVVTSDHGDMDMEHQQFYKMSPYDASTRVPLVIAGRGIRQNVVITKPASLLDLYPTLLEIGGFEIPKEHSGIDGVSLVPWLQTIDGVTDDDEITRAAMYESAGVREHPPVISQGHMSDNAISWFLVRNDDMKLVVYGTGQENVPQLFNITNDPSEWTNLALEPKYNETVLEMTAMIRAVLDFPSVALDVAKYNKAMFVEWYAKTYDWKTVLPKGVPNGVPGSVNGTAWMNSPAHDGAIAAVSSWIDAPVEVKACRSLPAEE